MTSAVGLVQPSSLVKAPDQLTMQQVKENQASLLNRINGAIFSSADEKIPFIDIGASFREDSVAKAAVAAEIGKACREIGFFQITNHGVSLQAREGVMEQARRFFHELPQGKKNALHIKYSKLLRGYEPSGFSNINPDNWKEDQESKETKEAFNWGYEPALDSTGGDGKYVELDLEPYPEGANAWPSEEDLPGFHTDYECFTLLLSSENPGLEVLSPHPDANGRPKWISAPALPESLTVNIANFFERWTNGQYKSTIHRVVNRSPEKERYSVPFFFSINYDETVSTLPTCISQDRPSQFNDIQAGPYILERLRATLKNAAHEYHKE